jgi:HEAT repeat protein
MRRYPLAVLLLVGTLCLGLGSGLTLAIRALATDEKYRIAQVERVEGTAAREGHESQLERVEGAAAREGCESQHSPQTLTADREAGKPPADTLLAKGSDTEDPATWTEIHAEALTDVRVREELMERYLRAADGDKHILAHLLSALHTPDVLAFAMNLSSATDVSQRQQGFELLAGMQIKLPEVRQLAMHALKTEEEPVLLTNAIAALRPAAVEPSESEAVIEQLRALTGHTDPSVRARALGALASWDKTGDSSGFLVQALADPSDEVRGAAVGAIGENRLRSEEIKIVLMRLANNGNEPASIRLAAATALERFPLSKEESEDVVQLAMEVGRQLYPDTGLLNHSTPY